MRRTTFWFDASTCSGCKACQVACKDRNDLEVGRLWRRVSEVAGGGWIREGAAWRQDVFAYHLSISCNHCERPICLEGCPARAIVRRDDGIVLIDPEHCLGCGYCGWVCPYSAPQYSDTLGTMSKCTFCVEDLEQGRDPACVEACPVRALDAGDPEDLTARHGAPDMAVGSAPLPPVNLTEPALHLAPHAASDRSDEPDTDLTPRPARGLREWSLVAFTLLSQMAAGIALVAGLLRAVLSEESTRGPAFDPAAVDRVAMPATAVLLLAALALSSAHLGRPVRAWRALRNLGQSWLSREILLAVTFLAASLAAIATREPVFAWSTFPAAALYLFGMTRVYTVRTVPVWNTALTPVNFTASALVTGGLALHALLWSRTPATVLPTSAAVTLALGLVALLLFVWIGLRLGLGHRVRVRRRDAELTRLGPTPLGMGLAVAATLTLVLASLGAMVAWPATALLAAAWGAWALAVASEISERQAYYGAYRRVGV